MQPSLRGLLFEMVSQPRKPADLWRSLLQTKETYMSSVQRTIDLETLVQTPDGQAQITQLWLEATGVPLNRRDPAVVSAVPIQRMISEIVQAEYPPDSH